MIVVVVVCGCSSINKYGTHGCDWRITFFNTGLNLDGLTTNMNLYTTGQKDLKWVYCYESYQVNSSYNCITAKESVVANTSFQSLHIVTNSPIVIPLPPPFPNSMWIIADDGFNVHSVPYYHIFNTTFCLEASEVTSSTDYTLSIQTIDSPIEKIYLNNTLVWSYSNGPLIYSIPTILIPRTGFQSGINLLKIVTYKWDLSLDNNPNNNNDIQSQYSALNVIGYLRTLKCCP